MYHLRPFEKRDFDELWKIDQQCFDPDIAFTRPELSSYIERRRSFTIVAELREEDVEEAPGEPTPAKNSKVPPRRWPIRGFITVEFQAQSGFGHVITIDVMPQHRRSGLGSLLIKAAEQHVRKLDGFMIVLEVAINNSAARSFYERHGFKVIKTLPRYYNHKLDGLFLTKRI